jgi:Tfp pilus assembly protein PilX
MRYLHKHRDTKKEERQRGFALVAALIAIMIIMAFGVLALLMSGRDILVSSRTVSEKRAFTAAETGIHQLMSNFDPNSLSSSTATNVQADPSNASSTYSVSEPRRPSSGPEFLPLAGYAIGGGQQWGQTRYVTGVTGQDTSTGSTVQIDIGLGYGPIEVSTMSR